MNVKTIIATLILISLVQKLLFFISQTFIINDTFYDDRKLIVTIEEEADVTVTFSDNRIDDATRCI